MTFQLADEVVVKIRNNQIVDRSATNFDRVEKLEIVALYEGGYFVYIPQDETIHDSIQVNLRNLRKFNLDDKFIEGNVVYIEDDRILRLHKRTPGMKCSNCVEFFEYAEPNQPDGKTMVCWSCRANPFR